MAAQTWDLAYFTTLVAVTGVGNTDSTAGDAATVHNDWPFDYANTTVSATGVGNTTSTGVGAAGTPQVWPITYWDGITSATGSGNTNSTGVGAVTAVNLTWYDLAGTPSEPVTGAGNTTSQSGDVGVNTIGTGNVSASGSGNTTSTGIGSVSIWGGETTARIVRDTYVASAQFGTKTVSSSTFGDRTTYIHPESTIP